MVLSEAEAEAQLAALRRQREALDRAINDLTLYLELGRRLTAGARFLADETGFPAAAAAASRPGPGSSPAPADDDADRHAPRRPAAAGGESPAERRPPPSAEAPAMQPSFPETPSSGVPSPAGEARPAAPSPADPSDPVPDPAQNLAQNLAAMEGALSGGVLARRYGRALIEAALAALDEAGRPLHAAEILAVLAGRGFSLPGHDPVAALNTRLWKRSGPGGPLRRMGDAVYALAEPGAADEGAAYRDEDGG